MQQFHVKSELKLGRTDGQTDKKNRLLLDAPLPFIDGDNKATVL